MAAVELVDIASIRPHPRNRRQGDIGQIAGMIAETGFHGAVIVQRKEGQPDTCVVGWHRTQALAALARDGYIWPDGTHSTYEQLRAPESGVTLPPLGQVPVEPLTISDEIALKKLLGDNRANDLAQYDERALADDLRELAELDPIDGLRGTGYDGDDLDEMLRQLDEQEPLRADHRQGAGRAMWLVVIECDGQGEQRDLLDEFESRGLKVRPVSSAAG